MGSPTRGMWTCRHNVDGRDFCPDCYQSPEESLLDRETAKPRLLSRQCSTCVGRPGNLMHLREGGLKDLIDANTGPQHMGLVCHQTLEYGDHPDFGRALCRWFYDTYGHLANGIRLFGRLGGFIEVDPPEKEDR